MNTLQIIYPGRFQPMHVGHYGVYKHLIEKFGVDNVKIVSSNKTSENSPLNFKQKRKIAEKSFNISRKYFLRCDMPYYPEDVVNKDLPVVIVVGKKDMDRINTNPRFEVFSRSKKLLPFSKKTYVYVAPMFNDSISATTIRSVFKNKELSEKELRKAFKAHFGFYDKEMFDSLVVS